MSKLVYVTGCGRGIGQVIALHLSQSGYMVTGCSRSEKELEDTKKKSGGKIRVTSLDVTDEKRLEKWFETEIDATGGTPWGLVTAAGVYGPIGLLVDNNLEDWIEAVHVNLIGTMICMKAVLPIMMKQKSGIIINLSGGGALTPFPNFSAYASSKAAVVRLTETIAKEVKVHNIRVNAIAPGAVNTRMLDKALKAGDACGKDFLEKLKQQKENGGIPPEKAAELAVFLASDESKGLTGKVISAVWDDWKSISSRIKNIEGSSLYTMRRIDEQNFKEVKV